MPTRAFVHIDRAWFIGGGGALTCVVCTIQVANACIYSLINTALSAGVWKNLVVFNACFQFFKTGVFIILTHVRSLLYRRCCYSSYDR